MNSAISDGVSTGDLLTHAMQLFGSGGSPVRTARPRPRSVRWPPSSALRRPGRGNRNASPIAMADAPTPMPARRRRHSPSPNLLSISADQCLHRLVFALAVDRQRSTVPLLAASIMTPMMLFAVDALSLLVEHDFCAIAAGDVLTSLAASTRVQAEFVRDGDFTLQASDGLAFSLCRPIGAGRS